jgi:hypothetical protein
MANFSNMKSIVDIEADAMNLARAVKVPVAEIVLDESNKPIGARRIDKRWGIKNLKTSEIVDFCSDQYTVLQHAEAVQMVLGGLRANGVEARGFLKNYNDNISVEMLLDNVVMPVQGNGDVAHNLRVRDDADGIHLGIRFVNSYNKSAGFRGHGFGWRLACSNGMFLRTVLPETKFSVKHTGDVVGRVAGQIRSAIYRLIKERGAVVAIVEKAQHETVPFKNEKEVVMTLAGYAGSEKQAANILSVNAGLPLQPTRWELYNAMTSYATHTAGLSFPMYEKIQRGAEQVLTAPVEIVIEKAEDIQLIE